MADDFTILGSFPITIVTGPTSSVDGIRINFQTIPSGIIAYASVPITGGVGHETLDADRAASLYIGPLATGIERAMGTGRVAGMQATEIANAGGQYLDYLNVVVQYISTNARQPGPFQTEIPISVFAFEAAEFFNPLVLDRINKEWAELAKLAGA